jgi:copper(I)-binding protein
MRSRTLLALVLTGALAVGAVACGDDDDDQATGTTAPASETTGATGAAAEGITVSDAWCRTSPAMTTAGACYLLIENGSDEADALVGASVPTSVAARTELHETAAADDSGTTMDPGAETEAMAEAAGEAMDDQTTTTAMGQNGMGAGGTGSTMGGTGGMMTMQPVDRVELPAGETVALEPGGYHIMLLDLAAPLEAGTTVTITLEFERAGAQTVDAEVRDA